MLHFYFFVRFDNIAHLDVVAVCQADTALEVGTYLLHVVLEALQGIDGTRKDYDTVMLNTSRTSMVAVICSFNVGASIPSMAAFTSSMAS